MTPSTNLSNEPKIAHILPTNGRQLISRKKCPNNLMLNEQTLRHLYFCKTLSARVPARTLYKQKWITQLERSQNVACVAKFCKLRIVKPSVYGIFERCRSFVAKKQKNTGGTDCNEFSFIVIVQGEMNNKVIFISTDLKGYLLIIIY